jgi:iron complex outermembrane receptor protein
VSKTPLTDANDVYAQDYHLINLKLSKDFVLNQIELNAFTGIENLLNTKYSLGNDLNAFGGRYFQPAPGFNFYVGLELKL